MRGEVLGRYDDLLDYYLSMMEYNKLETADLRKDFGPKPDGVPHAVVSRLDSRLSLRRPAATTCS